MQKNLGKIKRTVEEYVVLTVATLILVVGVYVFKFPNNFSFGGVTGLAVVLGAVLPTSPGNLTFIIELNIHKNIKCRWNIVLFDTELRQIFG